MPRSVEAGFSDFLEKLRASATETAATASHRRSIEACLRANFGLTRFTRIGSFGNGTNVSGYSDVDYLACMPISQFAISSKYHLSKVRDAVAARFPATNVTVRCPTVSCPFGTYRSEDTEIVVARYVKEEYGDKIYEIADCSDGWMRICPDAHNAYVKRVDEKLSGRVKPLIRLIKAWKFFQNVPISSFYLEMYVAMYASQEIAIVYPIDLKNILPQLKGSSLAAIQDPTGYSGYINPCKTAALKIDALSKLSTAATRAEKADMAVTNGAIEDAFGWWRLLYNDKFPSYYFT